MKRLLTIGLLAISFLSCKAQTDVTHFVPGSTLEGVNYFLPSTAFRVVIEAEKTVTTPGELNRYAFRYLRMNQVPTQQTTTWKISRITLEPYGVPDKTKAYNVKVKSKTLAPLVSLSSDGIILGINKEVSEHPLSPLPQGQPAPALQNPKKFMSQEMLAASSSAKLAELCAQEIYDIRESRTSLLKGEADNTPKDGAQLKLMLDELSLQAETLEQLFKGTTETSTHVFVLNVNPQTEGEQIVFRFSSFLGLVDADDLSGRPFYLNLKSQEVIPQPVEDDAIARKKAKMEKGIYYNVPARVAVTLSDDSQTYAKGEYAMGQFGRVEILSDALFNKNVTTKVSFHQETGGVERIEQ